MELEPTQLVPVVPFCHFYKKPGHSFHEDCPEYAQKFASYWNQHGQGGQRGGRPAPGCKMLISVLEDQLFGTPKDDEESVGDTPEVKVNTPRVESVRDQVNSARQTKSLGRKDELAVEVERVRQKIMSQQLISGSSVLGPEQDEPGGNNTPISQSSENPPVDMRAIRAFYVLLMIPI
ncbi:hypothetical protein R1flu_019027 [Riccia fluitans]|uniref:Uncharacterized protein n=1 Tax=Riccia fluitans TaxID=41844 RepID=A0ABD1ZLD7_9MARC